MKKILFITLMSLTFVGISNAGKSVFTWQDVDQAKTKEELQAACNKVVEEYHILLNAYRESKGTPQEAAYARILEKFFKKFSEKCSEDKGFVPPSFN